MPYQISEGQTSTQEMAQALGGLAGFAVMSPLGGSLLFGGLKLGAKAAWGTAKATVPVAAKLGWGATKAGAKPFAKLTGAYAGAVARGGINAARTVVGGAAYGAIKAGGWIYRNPGTALALSAPLALGMAAFNSERPSNAGVIGSPNMTEVMGGTAGQAGVSDLMASMQATGDVVLGMHRKR